MEVHLLDVRNLWKVCADTGGMIVDVRDCDTYKCGHIIGAINFPAKCLFHKDDDGEAKPWSKQQLTARVYLEKGGIWIVYCDRGNVSLLMGRILGEQGYFVYSLVGGFQAYQMVFGDQIEC